MNNTVADQPGHPLSLIIAFFIRFLESTIFNLATGKILASLCSLGDRYETSFDGNPEDRFCRDEAQLRCLNQRSVKTNQRTTSS